MRQYSANLLIVFGYLAFVFSVKASLENEDYYTSLVGIQKLAVEEQGIITSVLGYRNRLKKRLELLDGYLDQYQSSLTPLLDKGGKYKQLRISVAKSHARGDAVPIFLDNLVVDAYAEYVSSDPLLAVKILRRMSKELPELMLDFHTEIEADLINYMDKITDKIRIPNKDDFDGAMSGLLRVQSTYSISADNMVRGDLGAAHKGPPLDHFEAFYIGTTAINGGAFATGIQWLQKAREITTSKESLDLIEQSMQMAIEYHNNYQPDASLDMKHLYFEKELTTNLSLLNVPTELRTLNVNGIKDNEGLLDTLKFLALCGGQIAKQPSNLHCYFKQDTPLTKIAPVPTEILSDIPELGLVQFYNILSEKTVEQIIQAAKPHMSRATVQGTAEDFDQKSDIRTSTVTWISEVWQRKFAKIPNVIKDLTGFDAMPYEGAEELQVSCYGSIGGHYQQHFDPLFDETHLPHMSKFEIWRGDRLSTVMFYLSDVELGGGTAFPKVGVVAKPAKGSAVFWYNLKRNGERNPLSLHGGCPVAKGSKWVANKWIRSNHQMFKRKCSLDKDA